MSDEFQSWPLFLCLLPSVGHSRAPTGLDCSELGYLKKLHPIPSVSSYLEVFALLTFPSHSTAAKSSPHWEQDKVIMKGTSLGVARSGFRSHLCHLLAVCPCSEGPHHSKLPFPSTIKCGLIIVPIGLPWWRSG